MTADIGRVRLPTRRRPLLALPTAAMFTAVLTAVTASTTAWMNGLTPAWTVVVVNTVAIFLMFNIAHESVHYLVSRSKLINGFVGRVAISFVAPTFSLPGFRFIHLSHHTHVNETTGEDPDERVSHATGWRRPFIWVAADLLYAIFYLPRWRSRPRNERIEMVVLSTLSAVGFAAAAATGHLWTLAVMFFIPQRIMLLIVGWWFDWLPHHGLTATRVSNPYQATRARIGMDWLLTLPLLAQNYHLVHHLHPGVPFYRYKWMWRNNLDYYLHHHVAMATAFGRPVTADEYRQGTYSQGADWSTRGNARKTPPAHR